MDLFVFDWPIAVIDHFKLYGLFLSLKSFFTPWITLKCFECHVLIAYLTATTGQPITLSPTTTASRPTSPPSTKRPDLEIFWNSKLWTSTLYHNTPSFYTTFINSSKCLININNSSYNNYRSCDNIFFNYYKTSHRGGCSESFYLANIGPSV